ncbi:hypothetical protein OGAPHI_006867 [Ogataea philodendri]|uniref:Uncharacterized protein n=1 Tax=Ogataea philodendri TaxID=1378263 RepID=A0A9P8NW36_9ASCO|nr:uncharacterized protein OGAPHI_006867 [Ogataea philodendri]KAH3660281.1 hypothetical protein OGAPHI_006867 [Ogataea philodendri]
MAVSAIAFPEDVGQAPAIRQHSTLRYLLRLLSVSGYSMAGVYLFVYVVLKPMLKLSFERRRELATHCFHKLESLYGTIVQKVRFVPSVELNYRGILYKDVMCSTGDEPQEEVMRQEPRGVHFDDEIDRVDLKKQYLSTTTVLGSHLEGLRDTLKKLKVSSYNTKDTPSTFGGRLSMTDVSEMRPLMFQIKQLKNCVEMVSSDHPREYLFRRSVNYARNSRNLNIADDLRQELADLHALVNPAKN